MSSALVRGGHAVALAVALFVMVWLGGASRQLFERLRSGKPQVSEVAGPRPDDPPGPKPGSGTIMGTVSGADGRVVSYAAISVRGPITIEGRADAEGRYRIQNLPNGNYALMAAGGGYVALAWGQNATHEPATRVAVDSGAVSRADFVLPLGGTVTGTVADVMGNPIPGVSVAINSLPARPRAKDVRRWVAPDSERREKTDSEGRFRFDGVEPGSHIVTARAEFDFSDPAGSGRRLVGPISSRESLPTGVPLTVRPGAVERVTLKMREEPVRFMRGRILLDGASGGAIGRAQVRLIERDTRRLAALSSSSSDGTFILDGVFLPGAYDLVASSQERDSGRNGAKTVLQGSKPIVIDGSDLPEVELRLVRGRNVKGRIEFESETGPPEAPKLKVFMVPKRPLGTLAASIGVTPNAAGEFVLSAMAEPSYLVADVSPESGWAVSGLSSNGSDIDLQRGVEPGQAGLRLKLTNRLGAVSGSVMNAGRRFPNAIIVVVSEDRSKWSDPMSRFIRVERARQDGSFFVKALLPGDYCVVALSRIDRFLEDDDSKLAALLARSTPLTVSEGVTTVRNLTIATK